MDKSYIIDVLSLQQDDFCAGAGVAMVAELMAEYPLTYANRTAAEICDQISRFWDAKNTTVKLALLFDFKVSVQRAVMANLGFSATEIESTVSLRIGGRTIIKAVKQLSSDTDLSREEVFARYTYLCARLIQQVGIANVNSAALYVKSKIQSAFAQDYIGALVTQIYAMRVMGYRPRLAITGSDVLYVGFAPDQLANVLAYIRKAVMRGDVRNDRGCLLDALTKYHAHKTGGKNNE